MRHKDRYDDSRMIFDILYGITYDEETYEDYKWVSQRCEYHIPRMYLLSHRVLWRRDINTEWMCEMCEYRG